MHDLASATRGIEVGVVLRDVDLRAHRGRLRALATTAVAAGVDHLTVGDHVSFAGRDRRGRKGAEPAAVRAQVDVAQDDAHLDPPSG